MKRLRIIVNANFNGESVDVVRNIQVDMRLTVCNVIQLLLDDLYKEQEQEITEEYGIFLEFCIDGIDEMILLDSDALVSSIHIDEDKMDIMRCKPLLENDQKLKRLGNVRRNGVYGKILTPIYHIMSVLSNSNDTNDTIFMNEKDGIDKKVSLEKAFDIYLKRCKFFSPIPSFNLLCAVINKGCIGGGKLSLERVLDKSFVGVCKKIKQKCKYFDVVFHEFKLPMILRWCPRINVRIDRLRCYKTLVFSESATVGQAVAFLQEYVLETLGCSSICGSSNFSSYLFLQEGNRRLDYNINLFSHLKQQQKPWFWNVYVFHFDNISIKNVNDKVEYEFEMEKENEMKIEYKDEGKNMKNVHDFIEDPELENNENRTLLVLVPDKKTYVKVAAQKSSTVGSILHDVYLGINDDTERYLSLPSSLNNLEIYEDHSSLPSYTLEQSGLGASCILEAVIRPKPCIFFLSDGLEFTAEIEISSKHSHIIDDSVKDMIEDNDDFLSSILLFDTPSTVDQIISLLEPSDIDIFLKTLGDENPKKIDSKMDLLLPPITLWSYGLGPQNRLFAVDKKLSKQRLAAAATAFSTEVTPSLIKEETVIYKRDNVMLLKKKTSLGVLFLTNFRLIFRTVERSTYEDDGTNPSDIAFALCSICSFRPSLSKRNDNSRYGVEIFCKDFKSVEFVFFTKEQRDYLLKLLKENLFLSSITETFAFKQKLCGLEEWKIYDVFHEYTRMSGVSNKSMWRISNINDDYKFCSTYPREFVIPHDISDSSLVAIGQFRSKARIPVISWIHPISGATITRCAQPRTGHLGIKRCSEDELLFASLCNSNPHSEKLYLIDSRPVVNAVANTISGKGGRENSNFYSNCEVRFIGIGNIHEMRASFYKLWDFCTGSYFDDESHWLSNLESTKWLENIQKILRAASLIVQIVDEDSASVCTHCSDGWDRTTQLTSLSMLLLDPYYRSLEGFCVLVEKEWLSFGHQFSCRTAFGQPLRTTSQNGAGDNFFSPIFLMFLDCVWQILHLCPTALEFNEGFLLFIADSLYSCRFGTFLSNCEEERKIQRLSEKTPSVWNYVLKRRHRFSNPSYVFNKSQDHVLKPVFSMANLRLWTSYYLSCKK